MTGDKEARYIPPGSCLWCGHPPHPATCPKTIRTATAAAAPCPCARARQIERTTP